MEKRVLITGANTGIGLALVKKFLSVGFFVVGTSRNGKIESIQTENLLVIPLDVATDDSIQKAATIIEKSGISIDLLINNAGVGIDLDHIKPNINILKKTFDTNVFGLIDFTESILPYIKDGGTIFNISSLMGRLNKDNLSPNATGYRMSKAALNMYTKTLAARLLNKNVNVNSIHPGWVKTNMGGEDADLTPETAANGIYNLYQKNIPTATFWDAENEEQLNW